LFGLRIGLNELEIPILGLIQLLYLVLELRNALRLLIAQGGKRGERSLIVGIVLQNVVELISGGTGELLVPGIIDAGDILRHVRRREIELAVDVLGIELDRSLEVLD